MRKPTSRDAATGRDHASSQVDRFRPCFPLKLSSKKAVLDFDSLDEQGNPMTAEGLVKKHLLEDGDSATDIVALHGIGGVGKSTIIEALTSDENIRDRFSDGVHMIKLGHDASTKTLFDQLCKILKKSGADRESQSLREENDMEEVFCSLRTWFEGRRCAFFIDDVWERGLNLGKLSRLCDVLTEEDGTKVVITTREREIASFKREARTVHLRPRENRGEVARDILLFHAAVRKEAETKGTDDTIRVVLDICAGLPVSLAVAGKNVRKLSMDMNCSDISMRVWKQYLSNLQACRPNLLRQDVGEYENLYATLETSLKFLDEKSSEERLGFRSKFSFAKMHRRLCVLQKQAAVPRTMLMHLWGTESEEHSDLIASIFVEFGLASRRECGSEPQLTVHDSILDFAVSEAEHNHEFADAHDALLKGYGTPHEEVSMESEYKKTKWWSQELKTDGYIHEQLCRHLIGAGRKKELCELLLTPLWAERQIQVNGILSLENDFGIGMNEMTDGEETKEAVRLIAIAVSLSSVHVLKNVNELWFQIHGRLKGYEEDNNVVDKYMKWIESNAVRPGVLSVNRFLTGAGGKERKIISVSECKVLCMALFNDEERVACGCGDGRVVVLNLRRSEIERQWKAHERGIWSIEVDRDDIRIVTASFRDRTAKVFDVENGHCVTTFTGQERYFNCVAITHDGKRVASGSEFGTLEIWDIESGKVVAPAINIGGLVSCIWLLKDGERAVIGEYGVGLRIWNTSTGTQIGECFVVDTEKMTYVAMTPDELRVVGVSYEGTVLVWDFESRQRIWSVKFDRDYSPYGDLWSVAVSSDGSTIACGMDELIRMFDVESGRQVCDALTGHSDNVSSVLFLENNDSIVSCSRDGTVRTWDIARGQNEKPFGRHGCEVTGVSFTPDAKFAVTSYHRALRIWDAASGQAVGEPLVGHSSFVNDVAVTPDGRFAVSVSWDSTVRVWDLESRTLRHTFQSDAILINCVAVTPKGESAVTGSDDGSVHVWNFAKMDGSYTVFQGHNAQVRRVFVSDDGLRVISVDWNDVIVWNMETKDIVKEAAVQDGRLISRREVFTIVGENTVQDDAGLSIRRWATEIVHGEGPEARVLATLESRVESWDISRDKKTICVGLHNGQLAFLNVNV